MADDRKENKFASANWEVVALEQARLREAARRRMKLQQSLTAFVEQNGGWITSIPGAKFMRVEVTKDSSLPAKLAQLGFAPYHANVGTRITSCGFTPVDVLEISL
jgi:hypothetical protein